MHPEHAFVNVRLEVQEHHRHAAEPLALLLIQPAPAGRRL